MVTLGRTFHRTLFLIRNFKYTLIFIREYVPKYSWNVGLKSFFNWWKVWPSVAVSRTKVLQGMCTWNIGLKSFFNWWEVRPSIAFSRTKVLQGMGTKAYMKCSLILIKLHCLIVYRTSTMAFTKHTFLLLCSRVRSLTKMKKKLKARHSSIYSREYLYLSLTIKPE